MIPITKPYFDNKESAAVRKTVSSGWVAQGPKVKEFEEAFSAYSGSKFACAVSNCTTALHVALLTAGVKPGDAVITVSHSFIATANSIRYCGAEPVFVDIDPDTFNMSVECLERALKAGCDRRIAAIMPVHQMGMPCDMKSILAVARRYSVPVVEDAACAVGSEIKSGSNGKWERIGKPHSDIACFSFHPRKLITTGEGGMLTTNSAEFDAKFRLLRQHCMSVSDTARHASKKVVIEEYLDVGYNYRMSDVQAAIGVEQLKKLPRIIKDRRASADIYKERLKDIKWLKVPREPSYCRTNWQSYPVAISDNAPVSRDGLMQRLLDAGISTRRGIMNAHQEKPYRSMGYSLKASEQARDSVILLPMFCGLRKKDIEKIAGVMENG